MDPEKIGIAVALFERGFSEGGIEEALTNCSTLDSAIAWLNGPMAFSSTTPEKARESEMVVMSEANEASSGTVLVSIDEAEIKVQADAVVKVGTVIQPLNPDVAASWWSKASVRWLSIREALKAKYDDNARKRSAPLDDLGIPEGTPSKHLRREEEEEGEEEEQEELPSDSPIMTPNGKRSINDDQSASASPEASVAVETPLASQSPKAAGETSAQSSVPALASPKPSSRRENSTPGTSPRAQLKYNTATETCGICFNDVKKGKAVRLGCRHGWYCGSCMVKHAEARVEVGAAFVACPECVAPIAECNLRRLVPPEIIERLLARSLEQAVSATADLWACPTPNCPMRVSLEEGEEPRLRCTTCKKESCLRCGAQPYHKDMSCEEYAAQNQSRAKGSAKAKAEASFRKWMNKTGTKQCPTCKMAITKQNLDKQHSQYQECHKMMCRNCNTKFCFKCEKVLTDNFNCGCSIEAHGFVNPFSGKRMEHIRKKVGKKATKPVKRSGR
jgi:hypothetical protein